MGKSLIDIYEPRTSIHAAGGGIGQGLHTAIVAQIGCKDRAVVLMTGDGGFMVNVGEMPTAVQENLPLLSPLCRQLNRERHKLLLGGYRLFAFEKRNKTIQIYHKAKGKLIIK